MAARQAEVQKHPLLPDTFILGNETLQFVGVQERERNMTRASITMNRYAIVDQVLYGQEVPVEVLFRQLFVAVKRIGKPATGRAFKQSPRGVGAWPKLHDVMRWLDSLDDSEEKADEVKFLYKLYNTAKGRVRAEVLKELESGKSGEQALV